MLVMFFVCDFSLTGSMWMIYAKSNENTCKFVNVLKEPVVLCLAYSVYKLLKSTDELMHV